MGEMASDQPVFPEIDAAFFRDYGRKPADATYGKWRQFLKDHPRAHARRRYVHCLALCAGVSDTTVKNWLGDKPEGYKYVDEVHKEIFRKVTIALGWKLPRPVEVDTITGGIPRRSGPTRLALFTSLSVASESYHWGVVRSIVRSATAQGLMLSVHELEWTHPISSEQARQAGLIVTRYAPDAILMLRLTPTRQFLEKMIFGGRPLPVVLIHADRQQYPPPVLANVVPSHHLIANELKGWLWSRPHIRGRKAPKVVLAAMPEEGEQATFCPLPEVRPSIRNDRIAAIKQALEGFDVSHIQVDDYSFIHALKLFELHPKAAAYVCLSDQLAVGLRQLLRSHGLDEEQCRNRIVGFDGSLLAQQSRLVSLSQDLEKIGTEALDLLCNYLGQYEGQEFFFPSVAREIHRAVRLVNSD